MTCLRNVLPSDWPKQTAFWAKNSPNQNQTVCCGRFGGYLFPPRATRGSKIRCDIAADRIRTTAPKWWHPPPPNHQGLVPNPPPPQLNENNTPWRHANPPRPQCGFPWVAWYSHRGWSCWSSCLRCVPLSDVPSAVADIPVQCTPRLMHTTAEAETADVDRNVPPACVEQHASTPASSPKRPHSACARVERASPENTKALVPEGLPCFAVLDMATQSSDWFITCRLRYRFGTRGGRGLWTAIPSPATRQLNASLTQATGCVTRKK